MNKLLIAIFLGGAIAAQAGLSRLEAISMIETGDDDRMVGKAGEVSRYQIMPAMWKVYSKSTDYRNVAVSSKVALQHVTHLENRFRAVTGRAPTEFEIYVMWNAGMPYYGRKGYDPKRVASVIAERAERFSNLRHMRNDQFAGR
jgi:hypothetical protein